ncbi:hypothetical protein EON80_32080, partial [bacterium]
KAPNARALTVAFGPDSKQLVLGSRDGAVRLWSNTAESPTRTLVGHHGPVNSVCISQGGTIISAGNDGTVKLWDGESGRNLVTLFTLSESETADKKPVGTLLSNDWLAVTPEGYFDGSTGASRYVQWRLGSDVFPADAFEAAFRQPNAVGAALRGENLALLKLGAKFSKGEAVPPQVSISAPSAGQVATEPFKVQISATDDKSIRNVQLLINGRTVASQAVKGGSKPIAVGAKPIAVGAKPIAAGAKPIAVGAKPIAVGAKPVPLSHEFTWDFSLSAPIPRADGTTGLTVKAVVTDVDGLQGSEEIRLKRDAREGAFGTLRVLSIGVSHYANPNFSLKYASSDADAFAALW